MLLYKWVAVGSEWKTKPFPPTVHGVLLPSKPNVTIIYQQSDFDKWLSDFISHFFDFVEGGDFARASVLRFVREHEYMVFNIK